MSAKHTLTTSSDRIEWVNQFAEYFIFRDGFKVILRDDLEDIDNIDIKINKFLVKKDKDIDDLEQNEYVPEINLKNNYTGEEYVIKDDEGAQLYLTNGIYKSYRKRLKLGEYDDEGFVSIPAKELIGKTEESYTMFFVKLKNDELSKPLRDLKGFIEKGKELPVDNVSDLITQVRYLMKCGGIKVESVHIECLLRNVIRDADDITQLPDWENNDVRYRITSIHNGIMMSSSVINSLTFERLNQQLREPITYRKTGTCFTDILFLL
jgi:hypothetical protein